MTKKEFLEKVTSAMEQNDLLQLRELTQTYPQYIREATKDYTQRLHDDKIFQEQQDHKWQTIRAKLVKDFGEAWVNEHCSD